MATTLTTVLLLFFVSVALSKDCSCSDGEIEIGPEGAKFEFSSPGWPFNYCESVSCTWILKAPKLYSVELKFQNFDTELNHDYVEIFDGKITDDSVPMVKCSGRLCAVQRSQGSYLTVRFTSDSALSRRGFSATAMTYYYYYHYYMYRYLMFMMAFLCLVAAMLGCCLWPTTPRRARRIIIRREKLPEMMPIVIPITVSPTAPTPPAYATAAKDTPPSYDNYGTTEERRLF